MPATISVSAIPSPPSHGVFLESAVFPTGSRCCSAQRRWRSGGRIRTTDPACAGIGRANDHCAHKGFVILSSDHAQYQEECR